MAIAHVKAAAVLLLAPLGPGAPRLAPPLSAPSALTTTLPSPALALPDLQSPKTVNVAAVRAIAAEAQLRADGHGRATPELQADLSAAERELDGRLTRRARLAWQTLMASIGARTAFPFVTPEESTPFWLKDGQPLAGFRSSERLPEEADVVVIGAGLTGSAAAYALVTDARARGLTVVVLDSGDPSAQASGRNGGNFHLIPENYLGGYRGLIVERVKRVRLTRPGISQGQARFEGERQARAIVQVALRNREFLTGAVAREGIDADLAPTGSLRVPMTKAEERGLSADARLLSELGAPARMLSPAETDAALSRPAGASKLGTRLSDYDGNYHPFKYATGLLAAALRRGAALYTRVAVTRLEEGDGVHLVHTAEGVIRAKTVISAVNAFTAQLHPELAAVKAFRSQVQVTEHVADVWHKRTVSSERGNFYGHFTQRGSYTDAEGRRRGPLLLGGGEDRPMKDPARPRRSHWVLKKVLRQRDAYVPEVAGIPPSAAWSGSMGFTDDRLPVIGWLKSGLFVAAAYNGYGGAYTQAAAWGAAEAILSGQVPDWLPQDIFSPRRFLNRTSAATAAPVSGGRIDALAPAAAGLMAPTLSASLIRREAPSVPFAAPSVVSRALTVFVAEPQEGASRPDALSDARTAGIQGNKSFRTDVPTQAIQAALIDEGRPAFDNAAALSVEPRTPVPQLDRPEQSASLRSSAGDVRAPSQPPTASSRSYTLELSIFALLFGASVFLAPHAGYLHSLVFFFIGPTILVARAVPKYLQIGPWLSATAVISAIGWTWSSVLSYLRWWELPADRMVAWVLPYLPLEEVLFYPFGATLIMLLYSYFATMVKTTHNPALYWALLAIESALFLGVAVVTWASAPYYLISLLVLFNGLALALAPISAKKTKLIAAAGMLAALGTLGFVWDSLAIANDWWRFYAVSGYQVGIVPIEEFNLFFAAPLAGLAVYLAFLRSPKP